MPLRLFIAALMAVLPAPQASGRFPLKMFQVIRLNPEAISRIPSSVRPIFVDPLPDAELVDNLEEATKRTGFTARLPAAGALPSAPAKLRYGVTDPVRTEAKIGVADLRNALLEAKV